jgi:acyl-CoA synthetase (NDP forming)
MHKKTARLRALFNPSGVAVVGASENPAKLGFHVMKSLIGGGYEGLIAPVNPNAREIMGLKCHRSVVDIDPVIDLAIAAVPAPLVPTVLTECAQKGVKSIVLITAGFREIDDPSGANLQERLAAIAGDAGIAVIGPNTFGVIDLHTRLNASFTPEFSHIKPGRIALVSQSGGMSHLLGFLALRNQAGFSKIIGLGNRLNIGFAEMLDFLMDDPETDVIMLYMEGIDAPGRLLAVADRHRGKKPMVVYKTGRSEKGDRAARSHTGSLAGRHEIYRGAFHQAGITTVGSAAALLDAARALSDCPLPAGPGVAILSGQAGPAMAACDVCESHGLRVADFQEDTRRRIEALLPPVALRTNPVDMGPAWYDAAATRGIIQAALGDEGIHGLLLMIMYASANVDVLRGIGELLVGYGQRKPVVSCILSPPGIWDDEIRHLEDAGALVNFTTPEAAALALAILWRTKKINAGR